MVETIVLVDADSVESIEMKPTEDVTSPASVSSRVAQFEIKAEGAPSRSSVLSRVALFEAKQNPQLEQRQEEDVRGSRKADSARTAVEEECAREEVETKMEDEQEQQPEANKEEPGTGSDIAMAEKEEAPSAEDGLKDTVVKTKNENKEQQEEVVAKVAVENESDSAEVPKEEAPTPKEASQEVEKGSASTKAAEEQPTPEEASQDKPSSIEDEATEKQGEPETVEEPGLTETGTGPKEAEAEAEDEEQQDETVDEPQDSESTIEMEKQLNVLQSLLEHAESQVLCSKDSTDDGGKSSVDLILDDPNYSILGRTTTDNILDILGFMDAPKRSYRKKLGGVSFSSSMGSMPPHMEEKTVSTENEQKLNVDNTTAKEVKGEESPKSMPSATEDEVEETTESVDEVEETTEVEDTTESVDEEEETTEHEKVKEVKSPSEKKAKPSLPEIGVAEEEEEAQTKGFKLATPDVSSSGDVELEYKIKDDKEKTIKTTTKKKTATAIPPTTLSASASSCVLSPEEREIVASASDSILANAGILFSDVRRELEVLKTNYERVQANNKRLSQATASAGASFECLNQHAQQLQTTLDESLEELEKNKAELSEVREELAAVKASYEAEGLARRAFQDAMHVITDLVREKGGNHKLVEKILYLADKADSEAVVAIPALESSDQSNTMTDTEESDTEYTPTIENKKKTVSKNHKSSYFSFLKACHWST